MLRQIRSYALTIIIAFGISFIINKVAYAQVVVHQESMQSTYFEGDRLLENKWAYQFYDPEVGDVIIMPDPGEDRKLIKRVVAVEGDVVDFKEGKLTVNQKIVDESYAQGSSNSGGLLEYPLQVPADHVFVLGDNREHSRDSREFGSVPAASLEGKIVAKLWPWW